MGATDSSFCKWVKKSYITITIIILFFERSKNASLFLLFRLRGGPTATEAEVKAAMKDTINVSGYNGRFMEEVNLTSVHRVAFPFAKEIQGGNCNSLDFVKLLGYFLY